MIFEITDTTDYICKDCIDGSFLFSHHFPEGFPIAAEEACLQWQALVEVPSPQGPTRRARHRMWV